MRAFHFAKSQLLSCFVMSADGMCNYKGKRYQTGEKWVDGCDYECVCNDGSKGTYKCYNRFGFLHVNLPTILFVFVF